MPISETGSDNQPHNDLEHNKEKEINKDLEEMCAVANRVMDQVFPIMKSVHEDLTKIYNEIRERALAGGDVSKEDKKTIDEAIKKGVDAIFKTITVFEEQETVRDNFFVSELLQMRSHRMQGLPFGEISDEKGSYAYYLAKYLKTKDINDLPPATREMEISQFYIMPEDLKLRRNDLRDTLDTVIFMREEVEAEKNIKSEMNFSKEELLFDSFTGFNTEAFFEIIKNAEDAMPNGGEIKIVGKKSDDEKHLVLIISDTGSGMSPETLKKVLAGGFTTKPAGTGRGLGLVRKYFENILYGEFKIESEEGKGTTITIILPLAEKTE